MPNRLTTAEVNRRLLKMGKGIIMMDEYSGNINDQRRFLHDCEECEYSEWETTLASIFITKGGSCLACSASRAYTDKEINEILLRMGKGVVLMDQYPGNTKTPARFLHDCEECNFYERITTTENILKQDIGCPKCAGVSQLTDTYIDQQLIGTGIIRLDHYTGYNKTPMPWLHDCEECYYNIWMAAPNDILNHDGGCPVCARNRQKLTNDIIDERLFGTSIIRYDDYPGNNFTKMRYLHDNESCNFHIWWAATDNIIHRYSGCPECSRAKNERLTGKLLIGAGFIVVNKPEWIWYIDDDNKDRRMQPDFFLPEINTFIEYNGSQHYNIRYFGNQTDEEAEIALQKQQRRDMSLQKYCDQNNIGLIWIDGRKYKGQELENYMREIIIPLLRTKLTG